MEKSLRPHSPRPLLIGAAAANLYFYVLFLAYTFRWQHVLVGVFRELLTIPALIAMVVCGVLLAIKLWRGIPGRGTSILAGLLLAHTVFVLVMAVLL